MEPAVTGFTSAVEGYNVTNTYDVEETVDVEGAKTWVDGYANTPGLRPDVTINLWRDNPNPGDADEPHAQGTITGGSKGYSF